MIQSKEANYAEVPIFKHTNKQSRNPKGYIHEDLKNKNVSNHKTNNTTHSSNKSSFN